MPPDHSYYIFSKHLPTVIPVHTRNLGALVVQKNSKFVVWTQESASVPQTPKEVFSEEYTKEKDTISTCGTIEIAFHFYIESYEKHLRKLEKINHLFGKITAKTLEKRLRQWYSFISNYQFERTWLLQYKGKKFNIKCLLTKIQRVLLS